MLDAVVTADDVDGLESLEDVLEEIIIRDLPDAEMSDEERELHERHLIEMRLVDWVSAEELE